VPHALGASRVGGRGSKNEYEVVGYRNTLQDVERAYEVVYLRYASDLTVGSGVQSPAIVYLLATESLSHGTSINSNQQLSDAAKVVFSTMHDTAFDFRTPRSLSEELGLPEPVIRRALQELGERVRRAYASEPEFQDWYRLSRRGFTWPERLRKWRALAGRDAP
jgi:hypothetical protein